MSFPLAGNENYTKVDNSTTNSRRLHTTKVQATSVEVEKGVTLGGGVTQGGVSKHTVRAYLPSTPVALPAGDYSLLSTPLAGAAATVGTDTRLVTLPAGAVCTAVRYVGIDDAAGDPLVGITTVDIGCAAFGAAPVAPILIAGGTEALATAVAVGSSTVTGANRDLVGVFATVTGTDTILTAVTDVGGLNYLNVTTGGDLTSGSLCVEVDYELRV